MDSPLTLLTPALLKGGNQDCYVDCSKRAIVPLEQKLLSFRKGQRRRWRNGYCWVCACFVGFVLTIAVCVGLIVHNEVTLNGMQEKLEENLRAQLKEDILEELEASLTADVEKLVKKEEKRLLGRKHHKDDDELTRSKHGGKIVELTLAVKERLVKLMEEKVQGRLEEGLKQLNEKLSSLVDEKVQTALLHHPDFDLHQILKSAQVNTQDTVPFKRRHRRNTSQLTFVHLRGRASGPIYDSDDHRNFLWDRTVTPHGNGFRYIDYPNTGAVAKVQIKTRGIYLVYSQIAVHGNNNSMGVPFDCAQETVQHINSTATDNVLLKSLLTQYNMGAPIAEHSDGQVMNAMDTKLQMGIFALAQNDHLKVRYSENCGNFYYVMRPEFSYFGVLKLA